MQARMQGEGGYLVVVGEAAVEAVTRAWPGNAVPEGRSFEFEFAATTGDLVEVRRYLDGDPDHGPLADGEPFGGEDERVELALSEDAGRFGAEELGLEDVMAIRYGGGPKP